MDLPEDGEQRSEKPNGEGQTLTGLTTSGLAVRDADLLLVIGTSGVVFPAAGLVSLHQGLSIEINPQLSAISSSCTFAIAAKAAEATPTIIEAIRAGTDR